MAKNRLVAVLIAAALAGCIDQATFVPPCDESAPATIIIHSTLNNQETGNLMVERGWKNVTQTTAYKWAGECPLSKEAS